MARSASIRRRLPALAVASLSIAGACTLFNPLDEYGPPKPKPDGAVVATDADTGADASACVGQRWPSRPPASTAGGTSLPETVFAIDNISIVGGGDAGNITSRGYDLDNVCTCPGTSSCAAAADAPEGAQCDVDGGIDTAGTILLEGFIKLAGVEVDSVTKLRAGKIGLLFRLRDYNGQPDDAEVEFSVFLTNGTEKDINGDHIPPKFDGTDLWTLDPDSLIGGAGPPYLPQFVDTKAYVANGVLVANIDFPLTFSSLVLSLSGSVLTAHINNVGGRLRLDDGRIVGRWPTGKLLTVLDTVKDPYVDGKGLCGDSGLYHDLKKRICAGADITANPKLDNTNAPCDALSITTSFAASPAKLGSVLPKDTIDHLCGATWTDDCGR